MSGGSTLGREDVEIIDIEYKEVGKRNLLIPYILVVLVLFVVINEVTKEVDEELVVDYGEYMTYIEGDDLDTLHTLLETKQKYYGTINMKSKATYEFRNIHTGVIKYTLIQGQHKSIVTEGQKYIIVENYEVERYFK